MLKAYPLQCDETPGENPGSVAILSNIHSFRIFGKTLLFRIRALAFFKLKGARDVEIYLKNVPVPGQLDMRAFCATYLFRTVWRTERRRRS